jgi:hypothetical protein
MGEPEIPLHLVVIILEYRIGLARYWLMADDAWTTEPPNGFANLAAT